MTVQCIECRIIGVPPLTQWASGLQWSGKQLLDVELPIAFGQEPSGFTALLLRKWFIGAAARALQPGCKMDTMLVLVGPQGAGKSRLCAALGGPFFTDAKVDPDDDNGKRVMRTAWIVEWGELSSFRRAKSLEEIKDHLSKQADSYRPLYVEEMVKAPRHCAFIGTTNTASTGRTRPAPGASSPSRWWPSTSRGCRRTASSWLPRPWLRCAPASSGG